MILYENRSGVNIEDKDKQIDILSDGGEVLKTWTYLEKENPGKQFFHEGPWKLYSSVGGGGPGSIKCIWVFEISPEDISLQN